jgi:hypothetical protein
VDRLDVCTERIALVLGPDSVLAIARYVRKPAAAWTGDHAASSTERPSARIRPERGSRGRVAANIRRTPQMDRGESDLLVRDHGSIAQPGALSRPRIL